MNLRFLVLLAVFCATTTWSYIVLENEPITIARDFQRSVNKLAARKDTVALRAMFDDGFLYEGCDGKVHSWDDYIKVLFLYKGTGKVTTARADKRVIIFQVQYAGHLNEVMIRRNYYGWKFNRAQEMIC